MVWEESDAANSGVMIAVFYLPAVGAAMLCLLGFAMEQLEM